jgi:hypothetical protein
MKDTLHIMNTMQIQIVTIKSKTKIYFAQQPCHYLYLRKYYLKIVALFSMISQTTFQTRSLK